MIDLTDYGYVERRVSIVDAGGAATGSLGGPSDYINRPGTRYAVSYTLPMIPSGKEARLFESLLEQGSRDDVSYPFPLDFSPGAEVYPAWGAAGPLISGSVAVGAVVNLKALVPGYVIRAGQPLAVIHLGIGYVHKATAQVIADSSGMATVSVNPLTRVAFTDSDTVEIERPRIRGLLSWDGSTQGAYGRRGFSFTITERR